MHFLEYYEEIVWFSLVKVISSFSVAEEGLALIDQLTEFCLCWRRAAVYIRRKPCYQLCVILTYSNFPSHLINSAFFYIALFITVKRWLQRRYACVPAKEEVVLCSRKEDKVMRAPPGHNPPLPLNPGND